MLGGNVFRVSVRFIGNLASMLYCLFMMPITTAAQDDLDISKIPSRPYDHILDEARWFKAQEREDIQQELSRRFIEQQLDVYIVVLRDAPPQGVQTYARTLGEAWSRAPIWCVVLHIPGDPEGVHVEAGGAEIAQPRIDKAVEEALRRSRRENTEKDRVLAAYRECADDLRFVLASHQRQNERVAAAVDKVIEKRTDRNKKMKMAAIGAGLLFILMGVMIYFIIRFLKNRRTQFLFPETVWRERFLGPHSGGSGVSISYK